MYTLFRRGFARAAGPRLTVAPRDAPAAPVDLSPFDGASVSFVVYHDPDPIEAARGRAGLGSCFWGGGVSCPAGHPRQPEPLIWAGSGVGRVASDGSFSVEGARWPAVRELDRHRVVIAVAKRVLPGAPGVEPDDGVVEGSRAVLRSLEEFSAQLKSLRSETPR